MGCHMSHVTNDHLLESSTITPQDARLLIGKFLKYLEIAYTRLLPQAWPEGDQGTYPVTMTTTLHTLLWLYTILTSGHYLLLSSLP